MYRRQRVITSCEVRFDHLGRTVVAESEDLSENGVFVRTEDLLPAGDIVDLVIVLPGKVEFRVISRVAHLLAPSVARALGRRTGMGFEFIENDNAGRQQLLDYLQDLLEELTPVPREVQREVAVLVADPSGPLLERLSSALGAAGFLVDAVSNGVEAYTRCNEAPPDVIVAAAEMPVMTGWTLIKTLAANPALRDIPVMLTHDDGDDMIRLQAYRLGVRDFVHKPFTDEEIVIRVRRLAAVADQPKGSMLRGSLAEISIATLLSLLEFERKSGILVVLRDFEAARLFLAGGHVVKIEGPTDDRDPLGRMMTVLDWQQGNFEFTRCEVVGSDEIDRTTSQLLLEHAHRHDQRRQDPGSGGRRDG